VSPVAAAERYAAGTVPVRGDELHHGLWSATADAPVVLAIHGITAHHLAFPFLAQALPGVSVVAPDLRGRGGSRLLPGPWGLGTHADDCAALVRTVTDRPVVVVGHSMGAFVGVVLAHRHPALVHSLVLVDGGLPLTTDEVARADAVIALIRQRLAATFESPAAYRAVFEQHPGFRDAWTPEIAAYAEADLVGEPPRLRPATLVDAVVADQTDVARGRAHAAAWARPVLAPQVSFLHAARGLLDEEPGLYHSESLRRLEAERPEIRHVAVPRTNHYTIVMSEIGAAAVGDVVREQLPA
jgi:lipase